MGDKKKNFRRLHMEKNFFFKEVTFSMFFISWSFQFTAILLGGVVLAPFYEAVQYITFWWLFHRETEKKLLLLQKVEFSWSKVVEVSVSVAEASAPQWILSGWIFFHYCLQFRYYNRTQFTQIFKKSFIFLSWLLPVPTASC